MYLKRWDRGETRLVLMDHVVMDHRYRDRLTLELGFILECPVCHNKLQTSKPSHIYQIPSLWALEDFIANTLPRDLVDEELCPCCGVKSAIVEADKLLFFKQVRELLTEEWHSNRKIETLREHAESAPSRKRKL